MYRQRKILYMMTILLMLTLATTLTIIVHALYNTDFYRPVPGGVMISAGSYFATSSYVVEDQSTGERFLLVVYHLPRYAGTYEIYQPTTSNSYYYIGNVINYNEYIDAAVVSANSELGVEFDPRIRLPSGTYIALSSTISWNEIPGLLGHEADLVGVVSGYKSSSIAGYMLQYYYVN